MAAVLARNIASTDIRGNANLCRFVPKVDRVAAEPPVTQYRAMATLKLSKPAPQISTKPPVRHSSTARRPSSARTDTANANPSSAPPRAERSDEPRARPPRKVAPKTAAPRDKERRADAQRPQQPRRPTTESAKAPRAAAPTSHPPGSVRLSKRMSELGLTSRREADEWIERGWVRVDGKVIAELGSRVMPEQKITIDKRAAQQQTERVTILLNKPVGFVSGQAEDGHKPAITLITPDNHWSEDGSKLRFRREHLKSLAPAGRLDIDSVGLLVFTQDGRVAKQLIGDKSTVEKEYLVRVEYTLDKKLPARDLARLNHGLELDGVPLLPAKVSWQNEDQLRFVLREGKKRQIRRMCEAVGLKVLGLKRVRIGSVSLGKLPPGQWRYLHESERF
jgi:23S rRNA pseudouridine2604 synthase